MEGRKQAPVTLMKQLKEKGGTGEEEQPLSGVPMLKTQTLEEITDRIHRILVYAPM